MMRLGVLTATGLLLAACGQSGASGDDSDTDPSSGGVISTEVKGVSGSFNLGAEADPAAGFQLWLVDHSTNTIDRIALSDDGDFDLKVDRFTEDHVYSAHVLKDFILYGDIDFDQDTAGTQAAFRFGGGYGFSMGAIALVTDDHGVLVSGANALAGELGGGFTLSSEDGALDGTPPDEVTSVAIGHQLVITDPRVLLHSFYRSAENPALFARDLAALSRLGVAVDTPDIAPLARVSVAEAGTWIKGARLAVGDDTQPEEGSFWSQSNYGLAEYGAAGLRAAAFPGSVLPVGTVVGVKVTPTVGSQTVVWRTLTTLLSQPPQVLAANAAGSVAATISYASEVDPNGLTRAFCQTGDVQLTVAPPADGTGALLTDGTFDRIDVEVDYYGSADGRPILLVTPPEQLPAPFNEALSGTTGNFPWTWDPAYLRMTYTLNTTVQAASSHTITLTSILFPPGIGDVGVYWVRLRIYYRGTASGTEGGTVFWLDNDC